MADNFPELEQEIEDLSQKGKDSTAFRLSSANKEKIQEIAKRIDTKLNEIGKLHLRSLLIIQRENMLKLSYIYSRARFWISLRNIQRKLRTPYQNQ